MPLQECRRLKQGARVRFLHLSESCVGECPSERRKRVAGEKLRGVGDNAARRKLAKLDNIAELRLREAYILIEERKNGAHACG